MKLKNIDVKTLIIVLLSCLLIFSFLFGPKNIFDYKKKEIQDLQLSNKKLLINNDSLYLANKKLSLLLVEIENEIDNNKNDLENTKLELEKLKKNKNEIPKYVNSLSANDISNSFSDYISIRKKSKDSN